MRDEPFSGLSEADAAARLQAEGHNELPQPDRRTPFRIVLEVLREPMLALLLVGGIVYLALGDLKEAIILVAFATMSIVITVVQETRTERVLEALHDLTSPRALVIRGGERKRIAGGRGTDVAREASAIVLLDDDFGSIVKAIRLGRRIYDNLRKAMSFIFAVHVPIAGLALLPLVFGLPLLFGPIHIALLEMVIDPVCSLVFEAETEEDDVMRRPPRAPDEPLFSRALVAWSLLQGLLAFAVVAAIYVSALRAGMPVPEVRALTFFSLIIVIVSLILINRSFSASLLTAVRRPNRTLAAVLVAVAVILALTLLWPFANQLFAFGPLHADDLALTLGAGFIVLVVLEALKPLLRPRLHSPSRPSPPLAMDQTHKPAGR